MHNSSYRTLRRDVEYAVNNTIKRSTNEVPAILLYGTKQLGKTDIFQRKRFK